MPRPTTPLLSLEAIRQAGLEIIDNEGLERLSMRRLAERLGFGPPPLPTTCPPRAPAAEIADGDGAGGRLRVRVDWVTDCARGRAPTGPRWPPTPTWYLPGLRSRPAGSALRRADAVHGG